MLKEKILNVLHIFPFAYLDLSRGWLILMKEWVFACSDSLEKASILLWVTEDWSPVGIIWIRKKPTSDLVGICFSVAFMLMAQQSQLISVWLTGSEWKKKFWMYLTHQMRRCFASPGTQTIPHSHPPKLAVYQVCFWLYLSKVSGYCLLSCPWQLSVKQNGQKRDMSDTRKGRHAYKPCDMR